MKKILIVKCVAFAVAALSLLVAADAAALDGYQDRRGMFAGVGIGGGAAIQNDKVGGDMLLDVQIGGAPNKRVTFALDVDVRFQLVDGNSNWYLVPGPEFNFFLSDAIFMRLAAGLAFMFPEEDVKGKSMTLGMDASLGVGYEFFVNSNWAIDLTVEGDYFLLDNIEDVVAIGFSIGMKFY